MENSEDVFVPTILVVDDNKRNLQVVGNILHNEKYKVAMAINGLTALKLISQLKPDLVLLDIMMPEMDGYEVCKKLKENPETKEIPVIFLTAKVETNDIVEGFNLGGVDYITKPFKQKELLVRIKTHLDLLNSKRKIATQANELQASNIFKDRLFSIIGHDLRSPLSSIKFTIDMMKSGVIEFGDDFFYEILGQLAKTTDEAYSLLENLLGWAKSQSGNLPVVPEVFSLKDMAESVARLQELNLNNKNIELLLHINDNINVFADNQMINTVLRNLLSNAIKFTPNGGTIQIMAKEAHENMVEVAVIDSGVGISEDNLKRLFNNSNPLKTYGTNNEAGSGLGLILCKDFVEKNGGTLNVKSDEGKGSTFSFDIPLLAISE
ncbi:hybrid sensor histidine kinase/response regulator [Roseimarinus sediminis]|jgi:two-component system sensor histidine kinase/response regulator|uniref:hybrid sensor histidine kinase/response regulator n=1 Tax=Roseimarinus sediminis TaxID=1610899 RepID=UPI003D20C65E